MLSQFTCETRLKVNPKLRARPCQKNLCQDHVKKSLSRPCLSRPCLSIPCLSNIKILINKIGLVTMGDRVKNWLKTTYFSKMLFHLVMEFLYQITKYVRICLKIVNVFCQPGLSTWFVYMFSNRLHVLSTCFDIILCQHTLSTYLST